jgi:very-short-patch-repair endonuclease
VILTFYKKIFLENLNDAINELEKTTSNEYTILSKTYNNMSTKILVRHNICNYSWHVALKDLLRSYKKNGGGCPRCASEKRKQNLNKPISFEEFKEKFKQWDDKNEYKLLSTEYKTNKDKIEVLHKKCKHKYSVRPNDFQQGYRCPYCASINNYRSNNEKDVINFLRENCNYEIRERVRNIIPQYELDLYVPELKIAIEYDGLFWHSEEKGKDKNYHLNKTDVCKEAGIRLIHIFEDEWLNKQEIVKNKLLHILQSNTNPVIYARKCYVIELEDSSVKNDFLNQNHIQGKDKSILNLALIFNNEIVAIMTFCNLRKSLGRKTQEGCYELSRFATSRDYRVVGAFGKLWSYFLKNFEFDKIITYADIRWSDGNVYEKCGFKLSHLSKPNYWYIWKSNANKRFHRYNFRKQNLKKLFPEIYSDDKTEKEIMLEANYYKIWDCGNMVYEYENKKVTCYNT